MAGLVPLLTLPLLIVWPFTEAGRFLVPLVPFVLVGLVEGLAIVAHRLPLPRPRYGAAVIILALSAPYATYALATDRAAAQRRTQRDCVEAGHWLRDNWTNWNGSLTYFGTTLARHPGEVFLQTGHEALAPDGDDPAAIARQIERYDVCYLLVDEERFARAAPNPFRRYLERFPERVRLIWQRKSGRSSCSIYAVDRGQGFGPEP